MSKKNEKKMAQPEAEQEQQTAPQPEAEQEQQTAPQTEAQTDTQSEPEAQPAADPVQEQLAQQEDKFLRLAAEYDNYRKRTAKEKESLWTQVKADTAAAFLPVYDNLERAVKQETDDEAYKKGVEMTMTQLKEVFAKLGIEEIPALGQTFDPNVHNAVMHIDDDSFGENTIAEVFQAGFRCGEKVIRFSVVKVAN